MAYRDKERQREAERRWYAANKATVIAKKNRKRARLRAMVREAKSVPCMDCGVSFPPYVMDFDHVDGTKVRIVSQLVHGGSVSRLLAEMAKCEVVCANCHRVRTWLRLQQERAADQERAEADRLELGQLEVDDDGLGVGLVDLDDVGAAQQRQRRR